MKRGKTVTNLAEDIERELKPYSHRVEVAGSIRRHEGKPHDIDIVLIPKNKEKLEEFMKTRGKFLQGGEHEST